MLKSKLPDIGTTIFTKMTALANEHGAINLAQGFPDFPSSEKLIDLVHFYMKKGLNQYAPMPGVLKLREAIAEKVADIYKKSYSPEKEITITAGATQAIYTIISALVHEDDEVIIFEPAYDCYVPAIRMSGGIPVYINLSAPEYKINWEMVKEKLSHRTRLIFINTPHNPTGTTLSNSDLLQLEKIISSTDIMVLSDEVYEHIIFDKVRHESVLRYPKLAARSIAIYSFGKTYHNTGWKIGYILAPEEITKEIRSVHQFMVFSVNTPIQYALADYMKDKDEYISLSGFYQEKRDKFNGMISTSKFKLKPSAGTYFQLLDYSEITNKSDVDFAIELTQENKVASIPLSPFYRTSPNDKMLRFCFAKTDETLERAAEILCRI
jgi:methionine aminotransferase